MDNDEARQVEAEAAAVNASGAEATNMTKPAAATPAQSDGSENMLFRLADAATMDVDLEGSIGSPPTVQSRCTLLFKTSAVNASTLSGICRQAGLFCWQQP